MALRAHGLIVLGSIVTAALPVSVADAQSLSVASGRDLPQWLETWSPLTPQGDLPRKLPSASVALPSLLMPAPKVGLFWSAANPAALPWDVSDKRGDIAAARSTQDGTYRRPLDPAATRLTQISGMGWQPVEKRGALIGRTIFNRNIKNPGTRSDVNDPYGSSPFVVTDSSTSAVRQSRARLEGAGGWRLGNWGLGLSLGYDTRNTATISSPFARRNRTVQSGVGVGVVRSFNDDRLQAGLVGNWNGGKESISLFEYAQQGVLYALEGYREILPRETDLFYSRRMLDESRSGQVSLGGRSGAFRWVAYGGGGHFRQRLTSQNQDNPATDLWATTSGSGGIALQLPVIHGRALVTADAVLTSLTGHAEQVLPPRKGFDAEERSARAHGEIRIPPGASRWTGAFGLGVETEHRVRTDAIAKVSTTVDGVTPSALIELGRLLSPRMLVIGGYAIAGYSVNGSVPSPLSRGDIYKRFFAPELAIETSGSMSQAFSGAIRWQSSSAAAFWIAGRYEQLTPRGNGSGFRPTGDRSAGTAWAGVTLAGGT
ncbi:MAG: hypothetical protein Q7S20_08650 [Gemmatimonadaceae bacterium]|nr:hypothetical protein [Gemmatimonadaceae bacterium]